MALNPDETPREFLIVLIAAGLKVFGNKPLSIPEHFDVAEKFVAEAEARYGKIK